MQQEFSRTALLLGEAAIEKLQSKHIAVFGIGGVGGFVAEALARGGVGALTLVDSDTVCPSNINRQLIALHSTIGKAKVQVMRERILDINPNAKVTAVQRFYLQDTADEFDLSAYDYITDAIDTVTAKLLLIQQAQAAGTPVISSMGAGNKLDPTRFEVADIYATSVCPLARVMRHELRRLGVDSLKVVYSKEPPLTPMHPAPEDGEGAASARRQMPGSVAFVPPVAGLIIASEIIRDLIAEK